MKVKINGIDRLVILINLVITGAILWAAAKWFPGCVQIKDFGTLVVATLLIWLATVVIILLCPIILLAGAATDNDIVLVVAFIAICILFLFSQVIAITILSNMLDGFTVVGFWPKILISIVDSLLCVKVSYSQ